MTHPAPPPPRRGGLSPWGVVDAVTPFKDGVVFVSTPSHGGFWVPQEQQHRLPSAIAPMHGRSWFEEDCEAWVVVLAFDLEDDEAERGRAIAILAHWKPDWLDALAPACALPTAAQVAKIRDLWTRFSVPGEPDLAAFPRERDTGMVHGWIGAKLFVGVEPCGRAHS
jgi:hypothetical protein